MLRSSSSILRRLPLLGIFFSLPLVAQDTAISVDASVGTRPFAAHAAQKPVPQRPETYGTSQPSYVHIDASELDPLTSNNTYLCFNNCQLRYQTNTTGTGLMAGIHLPDGALITYVELDYYDNSGAGEAQASLGVCGYASDTCTFYGGDFAGCSDAPLALCSGNAATDGYSYVATNMTGDNIVVDNLLNRYIFSAGTTTTDGLTAISQIIVGYVLQVSPAPPFASFNDVPTSHPFFQYIEALYKSGITGGCGSGNYCPDAPLTRGQMAVFLSKALGLQWP
jgi:hypothetical protein